jgi:tetrahydromethanopterin S-methyltransferase subunit E
MTETSGKDEQPDRERTRPGPDALYGVRDITEETAQKLLAAFDRSYPIRRLRSSHVATGIVGTLGLALFLVGLENAVSDIPVLENGWASIVVGIILLAAAGVLIRRLIE